MRHVTDHIVLGDAAPQLTITVLDEPGPGGANHHYLIATPQDPQGLESGCEIEFQNGAIQEVGVNGVQLSALLAVVIDQLRGWQSGPFSSEYNAQALRYAEQALSALQMRTRDRIVRGVEGRLKP